MSQDFHAGVFYNWFIAQNTPMSKVMGKLYGQALPGADKTGFRASGPGGDFGVGMNSSIFVGSYLEKKETDSTVEYIPIAYTTQASASNNILSSAPPTRASAEPNPKSVPYVLRPDGSPRVADELVAVNINNEPDMGNLQNLDYIAYRPDIPSSTAASHFS